MCYYFIFLLPNFRSLFNPIKIRVKDFLFNKFVHFLNQNNSQCLLLNMRREILFSFSEETQTKKDEHVRIKGRKFQEKVRQKG